MSADSASTSAATGSAKDQVARLLTLVPYLQARGEVRVDQAAAALSLTPDQLLRDLKVLFMCGLPGGYPDDLIDVDLDALEGPDGPAADGLIRVSNADYLARPLRLTPTEASAIIVALRALRNGAGDDTREVVDRVLAKLEAAAAQGGADGAADPAAQVDPGAATDTDVALLATRLRRATDDRRQVRLTYYVPARDEQSDRVVDPRGVVSADGHLYLDAWCHLAEAPRLFRLDRIEHADVLESPVASPVQAPRDLSAGIFAQATDVTTVTLALRPEARWVVDYYPAEAVRESAPDGSGGLEVDLLVADERWLTRLLLRLTPHARVLSPPAYAEAYRHAAQAMLALYPSGEAAQPGPPRRIDTDRTTK